MSNFISSEDAFALALLRRISNKELCKEILLLVEGKDALEIGEEILTNRFR